MRVLVLGITILSAVWGQSKPDVAEILRKVEENYSNAKQYRFVLKQTGEDNASIEIAVEKPDKFHFVTDGEVIGGDGRYGTVTMVSNGSTVWNHAAGLQQYTKKSTSLPLADTEPPDVTPDIFVFQAETLYITRYARLASAADHAALIRQEAMQTAAGRVDCYVIQLKAPLPGFREAIRRPARRYSACEHALAAYQSGFLHGHYQRTAARRHVSVHASTCGEVGGEI